MNLVQPLKEFIMKHYLCTAVLMAGFIGIPMMGGCDDKSTTTKTETKTSPNGATSVDKSQTTTDSEGNRSTSTEHRTTPPSP
jgi:hypothetical protein